MGDGFGGQARANVFLLLLERHAAYLLTDALPYGTHQSHGVERFLNLILTREPFAALLFPGACNLCVHWTGLIPACAGNTI